MTDPASSNVSDVMANIPHGAFIMTASHDGHRHGTLVRWIQPCSIEPPMVMLAVPKGQVVEPLIRDSRHFALCQVREGDRYLLRKFEANVSNDRPNGADRNGARAGSIEHIEDPFVCLPMRMAPSGSPVIERSLCYLDCEVSRQVETDGDHRIYVGVVTFAEILQSNPPAIFFGRVARTSLFGDSETISPDGDAESKHHESD
jgi:flavin reductase (DIM6/NTAB) family NADH-FMN oxidoreductase RutF